MHSTAKIILGLLDGFLLGFLESFLLGLAGGFWLADVLCIVYVDSIQKMKYKEEQFPYTVRV
jgi:hypothetical protein